MKQYVKTIQASLWYIISRKCCTRVTGEEKRDLTCESLDTCAIRDSLQEIHDLSYTLCAVMRRKPDCYSSEYTGVFQSQMVTSYNIEQCKDKNEGMPLFKIQELAGLYHSCYKQISILLANEKILRELYTSIGWFNKSEKVLGLPVHRFRRYMEVSRVCMHNPKSIGLLHTRKHKVIADDCDVNNSSQCALEAYAYPQKLARALRDRMTLKYLLKIIEEEWPKSGGNECIPLHVRLAQYEAAK